MNELSIKKKKEIDLTTGNLFIKIIKVALPLMLSGVLQLFYNAADLIVCGKFGSETHGLPERLHEMYKGHGLRVPMDANARCLNLSNTVAIIVYEALRQQNFPTLSKVNVLEG